MLLLKIGLWQVYEVIVLLANLNYLITCRNNLNSISQTKVYLGLGGRLLKIPEIKILYLIIKNIINVHNLDAA